MERWRPRHLLHHQIPFCTLNHSPIIQSMKTQFLSILFVCILATSLSIAQPQEIKSNMSLGTQTGISIDIENADADLIEDVLEKYLKEFGKLKKNKKAKEHFMSNAQIPSVHGADPLDVYVTIGDRNAVFYFDLKTAFLNSKDHSESYRKASEFVQNFSYEVQRAFVVGVLDQENHKLKKLNNKLDDLKGDNAKYHKDIEEAKAKIKKREDDIQKNLKDQDTAQKEIEMQTKAVDEVRKKLQGIGRIQ